ncbi:GNAT family N-acetyltransferase [Lentilitoribacter sp. EG35]|uniref:GNAT family N-acetyltransferase n=1 Tax=Lentilitoribacter sp. EG35 TaxID=3234192 RepID=UPI003460126B
MYTLHKIRARPNVAVIRAIHPAELDAVRGFMRDLVEWLFERHHQYIDLVRRYFDPNEFDAELKNLPGDFASPKGVLLLALVSNDYAGCVGLRDLGEGVCEMKRLYVDPVYHGHGIGEALVEASISQAQYLGYSKMRLDTGPKQVEARGLYAKMGFTPIPAYYDLSAEMEDWLTFMEYDLTYE